MNEIHRHYNDMIACGIIHNGLQALVWFLSLKWLPPVRILYARCASQVRSDGGYESGVERRLTSMAMRCNIQRAGFDDAQRSHELSPGARRFSGRIQV